MNAAIKLMIVVATTYATILNRRRFGGGLP
jgi:hypothetical protein